MGETFDWRNGRTWNPTFSDDGLDQEVTMGWSFYYG